LNTGVIIPRAFVYHGVAAIIENGVARDILKAGMAALIANSDPVSEKFRLSAHQVEFLVELVGRQSLVERGLV
jgi:hypothetical protein